VLKSPPIANLQNVIANGRTTKLNDMITFNERQKTKIKSLKPHSDSRFLYKKERWTNLNPDFKNLINDFEDKEISRQNVIDAYKEYYEDSSKGFMKAFLLTMVWGFADTGYGTHRTNKYIGDIGNINKIKEAIDFIQLNGQDNLKNAFKKLKDIKGLGVSYLTKILYFATKAKYADNYALIFDIRVAAALVKLTTPNEIYAIVNVGPSSKFTDYQNFNSLIHKLAKDNQVEADQMEMYLFNQDFD
jgi:hypothetical protein